MLHLLQYLAPLKRQHYPLGTKLEKLLCSNSTLVLDQKPLLKAWPRVAGSFLVRRHVLTEQEASCEASDSPQSETEYEAELAAV
jgi:hypothetical protein